MKYLLFFFLKKNKKKVLVISTTPIATSNRMIRVIIEVLLFYNLFTKNKMKLKKNRNYKRNYNVGNKKVV